VRIAVVASTQRVVAFESELFYIDGEVVSSDLLKGLDQSGQLVWESPDLRSLFLRASDAPTAQPLTAANPREAAPNRVDASSRQVTPAQSSNGGNGLQYTAIVLAVLCGLWTLLHPFMLGSANVSAMLLDFVLQPFAWVALGLMIWGDANARRVGSPFRSTLPILLILGGSLVVSLLFVAGGAGTALKPQSQPQTQVTDNTQPEQLPEQQSVPKADLSDPLGGVKPAKGKVFLGSTASEIVASIGEPTLANEYTGETQWTYVTEDGMTARIRLVLKDGHVSEYNVEYMGADKLKKFGAAVKKSSGEVAVGDTVAVALGKMGTPPTASMPYIEKNQGYTGTFVYYSDPASKTRVPIRTVRFYNGVVETIE